MNELLKEGVGILSRAEADLRGLLGRAATAGDYDGLVVLAEWARQLRGLLDEGVAPVARRAARSTFANGTHSAASTASSSGTRSRQSVGAAVTGRRRKRAVRMKKRKSPGEYPKFLRDGDSLVKIGWSKSAKSTYEHRAPRRVIEILALALKKAGDKGRRFTMEENLPLKDPGDGTEIPTYQVYVSLAWLRQVKLVEQHGRQGYSLPDSAHLDALAGKLFEQLPRQ